MYLRTGFMCLIAAIVIGFPARSQNITTVAANSTWGAAYNVTADSSGSLYSADYTKHVVYKIDRLGSTTIAAGNDKAGYSGDGGLATSAQLNAPLGTAVARTALDGVPNAQNLVITIG